MGRLTRRQRIVIYVEMAVRALAIIMLALALGIFIYTSVSWDYNILHGYIIVSIFITYDLAGIVHLTSVLALKYRSSLAILRLYLMSRMALEAAAAGGAIGGGVVVFSEPSSPPDCESPTCQAALQIGVAREPAATLIWIAA
ncbi:hypothetical protein A9K55_000246 [Cordyceps militaris]|uniref:Uncharacterized protein n=1 Tax=Cordyceps militaris TaxID=73501 RepID=A0A2H4SW28_CORMI|nr:hypothetical protein A9K55_000246 [Cordyceps militaris]